MPVHLNCAVSPPHLVLSVLFNGLLLVQAGQSSVVPLVQLPRVLDGDVHLNRFFGDRARTSGTRE